MANHQVVDSPSLEALLVADTEARVSAREVLGQEAG